ncbi:structural maintenance of chromosomes protein 3-like [Anopheles ziemanni]|uniref:structural maintenance of chromosomes protein 3-like n=1 Tax=Anopheles coustani TaxID=139045 RepID=UPI00265837F7|nr:structural maintenance of chromosomes protein 3-like [Anopheles coustani]XP_058176629.1 structural maintenance of chromosomes protein 3-like [Anopheles ziemanni]
MHIKQVIIQGFKSYREQTVVEPFDKRHNVVVGRNGSGKSNFFYAIQFVLSDEFTHLRPEQRQALLHEGTGPRAMSAYVEIIFDNTDNRVPIDKEEIFLRRVIGAKKDQYFLNKKVVPRSEVVNLLESAGFSNSNPYYIVKQGKINQMATAPDSHRLKLLREVAGTRVYDERKEESMNLLRESEGKLDKITEYLRTIEDRLKTLEEEKEELSEYQKWDKARRTLEYIIHETELKDTRKQLEDLDVQRKSSGDKQKLLTQDIQKAQERVKAAQKALKDAKKDVVTAKDEKSVLATEHQQLLREKTKLDLTISDLSDEVQGDNKSKERAEQELDRLKITIAEKEKELEQVRPRYEAMRRKEEECSRELNLKEQKRKELYAKQGRGSQFSSKEERDKWIQGELKSLNKQIKDKIVHQNKLQEDLKKDITKHTELEKKILDHTETFEQLRVQIDEHNKHFYELKKRKDHHQTIRNDIWKKETAVTQTLSGYKEELAKADQALRSMAGKPILNGRDSVRKVLESFQQRGGQLADIANAYYGPVIENFNCDKSIYTAVEVTAGNRLFHHIVESDRVGTQILKEMNKQKLPGEVTFMPLNRLQVKIHDYPEDPDSIPMISKLKYEEQYDKALRYIFGKTLICRNLERATELAKSTGLDCVTLEGDQVSSKGSLTGGYFNTSRSRLEMQKKRSEYLQQIQDSERELSDYRTELKQTEASINSIVSEMQKTETKQGKSKDAFEKIQADIRLMKDELTRIERFRSPKERSLAQCKANLEAMNSTKDGLENELHQELMSQLSVQDQHEVDSLNDEIRRLNQENKEAFTSRMSLEVTKNKLENLLTNNLFRRKDELVQALQEISVEDRKRQLTNCHNEVVSAEKRIKKVLSDTEEIDRKLNEATKQQKTLQKELETWLQKEKEAQERLEEDGKRMEKWATKENLLHQKIEECTEKIAGLGALPNVDASYQKMSLKALFRELEKANQHLKKYNHVNKKALDQFLSFSEQKEKLYTRKAELDVGKDKICELMQLLEARKVEAIQFTFRQVAANFTEVFKKLVPQGTGHLILRTTTDQEGNDMERNVETSDEFTGIGIRVSFTGLDAEMREMNQLSGGQKSLVALALIFAIQKCDPAPFYLFDEIDQALDAQHRSAVADMIHELSDKAQFITTTFRPELMEKAHKFYGVRFRNKVSHVDCVSKEVARDFVDDDTTHG